MLGSGRDNSRILISYLLVSSSFCSHNAPGRQRTLKIHAEDGQETDQGEPDHQDYFLEWGKKAFQGSEKLNISTVPSLVLDMLPAPVQDGLRVKYILWHLERRNGIFSSFPSSLHEFLNVEMCQFSWQEY